MTDEQIAAGILAVFICFPVLVLFLMGRFSLWTSIARKYPSTKCSVDHWDTLKLFSLGATAYRRCTQVSLSATHIHFRQIPPFSLFYRPISVPYEKVVCIRERDYVFIDGFKNYSFVLPPDLFTALAHKVEQCALE